MLKWVESKKDGLANDINKQVYSDADFRYFIKKDNDGKMFFTKIGKFTARRFVAGEISSKYNFILRGDYHFAIIHNADGEVLLTSLCDGRTITINVETGEINEKQRPL